MLEKIGKTKAEVIGRRWTCIMGDEGEASTIDEMHDSVSSQKPVTRVVRIGKAVATVEEHIISLVPIWNRDGELMTYFGSMTQKPSDFQTAIDDELLLFQKQMSDVVNAMMVTSVMDPLSKNLSCSIGLEDLTGFSTSELQRLSFHALRGPTTNEAVLHTVMTWKDVRSMTSNTLLLYREDGSPFWASIFTFPFTLSQFVHVVIDVTSTENEMLEHYILGRTIGSGASGIVRIAKDNQSGDVVAIKIVDASKFRTIGEIELVQDEISALSSVKHPNIINLRQVLFQSHVINFVMDFACSGSLADHLKARERRVVSEEEARKIFRQVIDGVSYCHRRSSPIDIGALQISGLPFRRVIHRDLKPENILLDGNGRVQVADFGLSAIGAPCGSLSNVCGTPEFLAPEVLSLAEYDGAAADIWSLGIILHELVTGTTPFKGKSRTSLFRAIQCSNLHPLPEDLSDCCRELISLMLTKDPDHRISMEEILAHAWMKHESNEGMCLNASHSAVQKSVTFRERPEDEAASTVHVHESAKLTLGDWTSGDDAISNAIVSGDYSRSPSIVIVRNSGTAQNNQFREDLEKLRASNDVQAPKDPKSKKLKSRYLPFFMKSNKDRKHKYKGPNT